MTLCFGTLLLFTALCPGSCKDSVPILLPHSQAVREKLPSRRCPLSEPNADAFHQAKLRQGKNCVFTSRLRERVYVAAGGAILVSLETTSHHLDKRTEQNRKGYCVVRRQMANDVLIEIDLKLMSHLYDCVPKHPAI